VLWRLRRSPHRRRCVGYRDMAARGLYKETDGSWRQADADKSVRLLYRLKKRERWTLLDRTARWWFTPPGHLRSYTRTGAWRRSPQRHMPSRGLSAVACSSFAARRSAHTASSPRAVAGLASGSRSAALTRPAFIADYGCGRARSPCAPSRQFGGDVMDFGNVGIAIILSASDTRWMWA
jgi:hypothetical protein